MAKILFVSHIGAQKGGAPESLIKLLPYLQDKHQLEVLVPHQGELSSKLEQLGIQSRVLHFRLRKLPYLLPLLAFQFKVGAYDLIYANGYSNSGRMAFWSSKLANVPFIWHIREVLGEHRPGIRQLRYAAAVIAISEACVQQVPAFLPERVAIIPNGVELSEFIFDRQQVKSRLCSDLGLGDHIISVANIGRITHQKNQLDAVLAVAPLIKSNPSVHLLLIGDTEIEPGYVHRLRRTIHELGLDTHVHFLGHRPNAVQILGASDVLLHSSRTEGQGRVILEAMACSIPQVAYDVGGVRETLVAGETGFLVPLGNLQGLSQAVGSLIADTDLRNQMGVRGREIVTRNFDARTTARRVESFVSEVLSHKTRPQHRNMENG